MNKIDKLFAAYPEGLLNIFFTAGYPKLNSTIEVAQLLNKTGVKLIEIGMPYSDPLADGTTIQESSQIALTNGMNLNIMFKQIEEISHTTDLTIVLMGYLNQIMSVGVSEFLSRCKASGVTGLIIPDLPMDIYEEDYKSMFEEYDMTISFLISPRTAEARIREADRLSTGFLYMVADNSITGGESNSFNQPQLEYFERIHSMKLISKVMIGFGIKTGEQYRLTKKYANGAIIGSEFIRQLNKEGSSLENSITKFVTSILKD